MSAYGVADPAQLCILTKALNDYCARHPVSCKNERDREDIALKVMSLFLQGIEKAEDLVAELERAGAA